MRRYTRFWPSNEHRKYCKWIITENWRGHRCPWNRKIFSWFFFRNDRPRREQERETRSERWGEPCAIIEAGIATVGRHFDVAWKTMRDRTDARIEISIGTYLKKSSLQKTWPFFSKHLSVNLVPQSRHVRHLACQHLSRTLSAYWSKMASWQPPHFGIETGTFERVSCTVDAMVERATGYRVIRDGLIFRW